MKTLEILKKAQEGGYAVGAFNTINMETTQAIVRAAHNLHKDCIVQMTYNTMRYSHYKVLGNMIRDIIKEEGSSCNIGFHLDHGKNLDQIMEAIEAGVDSVMIDASTYDFRENIEITKRVVDYAHERGVCVQAELGTVPYLGRQEQEVNWDEIMTDPDEAQGLIEKTGVDALAVGIGNAHGFFKEREEPDWARLEKIRKFLPNTPLVMHGASDWNQEKVQKAVEYGVCCFNVDTDTKVAAITAIYDAVSPKCDVTDLRKVLGPAREEVMKKVEEKLNLFTGVTESQE